jgi:thioredoxin reductase (NADPH)
MQAIVWSKNNCLWCNRAKQLLEMKNVPYEDRNIDSGSWTKEQLFEAAPGAKSLPQVFVDNELIGGYDQLREFLK